MSAETIKRVRWFWPWQDAKEEAWLESMAQGGWLLKSVGRILYMVIIPMYIVVVQLVQRISQLRRRTL